MEDVDKIILSSVRELGCNGIDDVQSLKQCTVEQIIAMTVHCLKAINPNIQMAFELPTSISARFNMCAKLAQICSVGSPYMATLMLVFRITCENDLGYRGEVGFHTFLYCSESNIRKLFMFLVEKFPREDRHTDEYSNRVHSLRQNIGELLKSCFLENNDLSVASSSSFISNRMETGTLIPGQKLDCTAKEWKYFVTNKLPFINEQISNYQYFLPSVITLNSRGILHPLQMKRSQWNFHHGVPSEIITDDCDSTVLQNHTENLVNENEQNKSDPLVSTKELKRGKLMQQLECLKVQLSDLNCKLDEVRNIYCSEQEKSDSRKNDLDLELYSVQLLPDAETNKQKLQLSNEKFRRKMEHLIEQWNEYQQPFLEKSNRLKECHNDKMDIKLELLQEITSLKNESEYTDHQIQYKTMLEERLTEYLGTLKGPTRGEYTERIVEIIGNIKKQDNEIRKILSDTKVVQREINNLTEKTGRTYEVVDKQIFSKSCEDGYGFACEAYDLLLLLHNDCYNIINLVGDTGAVNREIRTLEEQLIELRSTVTAESITQITEDIKNIKAEQELLVCQLSKVIEDDMNVIL